jgi:RNA polymerase-binding transcription factor DksA
MNGICEVCGKHGPVVRTIYGSTGRVAVRCPEDLNQPEDFRGKVEAHYT